MTLLPGRQYDIFCDLISDLHQCTDIHQLQKLLAENIGNLIPTDSSILLLFKEDGITVQNSLTSNLNPKLFNQYRDYYQKYDLYKEAIHRLPVPPVVNRCSDYLDYASWSKNEHRGDFLLTQGVYHISCLEIFLGTDIVASICLHRNKHHDNFSDREMEIMRVLVPIIKANYQSLSSNPSIFHDTHFIDKLTARERQLIPLLMSDIPNEQIARQLHLSHNTVKTHIRHILRKANCTSRFELIIKLVKNKDNNREKIII